MSGGEGLRDADLYESDFFTWTQRQSSLIRDGRLRDADLANIAEEIESLGRSQVSELRSRYRVLCLHLLKTIVQPERNSRSWTASIIEQRLEIAEHLEENPGLEPLRSTLFKKAYGTARKLAAAVTGIEMSSFPKFPPFTMEQAEDEEFWPASQTTLG